MIVESDASVKLTVSDASISEWLCSRSRFCQLSATCCVSSSARQTLLQASFDVARLIGERSRPIAWRNHMFVAMSESSSDQEAKRSYCDIQLMNLTLTPPYDQRRTFTQPLPIGKLLTSPTVKSMARACLSRPLSKASNGRPAPYSPSASRRRWQAVSLSAHCSP